ncbi:unnamed protein product [Didymodactylos carnosus]|uniref:NAD(P)(+)--arginine ADP-ribosyltransferase n=1 Tax=Didymodactylos carnosus TaxID=1234261 RepID=A0A815IHY1_9BILA|nr:unnamed protein product [Didymodactylos carnosus]CAF1368574.1 unnamed protein product [Didymodactylos carnosus]CAF3863236.1 unnamed protein product [Didymodactylos carnosus]CAF4253015.1 unnamed protein product [Didymodactylos carnosus]
MAENTNTNSPQKNLRFLDVDEEPRKALLPIEGYQDMPLMSLEEAIKPLEILIPKLSAKVWVAKENCQNPTDGLNCEESSAIQLYTFEWYPMTRSFYYILNRTLRSEDRQQLIPWFAYLKLFLSALFKLPSVRGTIWRGVKTDLSTKYPKGIRCTWWGVSSCTDSIEILQSEQYLGKTGARTLFSIECTQGKVIKDHSYFKTENEIILLPGTYLEVISQLELADDLHIIQLKQIEPPFELLQPPSLMANVQITTEIPHDLINEIYPDNTIEENISQNVQTPLPQLQLVQEQLSGKDKNSLILGAFYNYKS